ncbi:PIR Superfamily Protein [Plasmodium ovale wallikeri]|uniref:PIR Superfamily Protein n=1 Tax=Plasmodium ovale wallikeri TaxID=864142 RepID=A0A1A9AH36_PLAOA|nr:PIR Superfamily Protein [Plasmodium ovale wallikeri]SBT56205.1 PIR Superfamily Protein [Plasmodium ovale wallikeri]
MDPFFQNWDTKYPLLIHSGLYKLYNLFFSNDYDTDSLEYACNIYLDKRVSEQNNLRIVCLTAERALENLNSNINAYGLDNIDKACEYMKYWIFDRIKNINASTSIIQTLYSTLEIAKESNNIYNTNCNIEYFDVDKVEFVKKKELYFHREILDWIKKKYETIYIHNFSYQQYLHDCAKKYNTIVQNNDCKKFKSYKQELKDFKVTFEDTKNFLLLKREITSTDDLELSEIPMCSSIPSDTGLENAISGGLHTPQIMDQGVAHSEDNNSPTDDASTDNGITGGIVSSITLGMIFLFFISYKFTPFGQKLHQLKGMPKKMFNKAEDESHELSIERGDSDYIELNNDMYNMQYHSIQNY